MKSKVKMSVQTSVVKGKFNGDYAIFYSDNGPITVKKINIYAKSPLPKAKHPSIDI